MGMGGTKCLEQAYANLHKYSNYVLNVLNSFYVKFIATGCGAGHF